MRVQLKIDGATNDDLRALALAVHLAQKDTGVRYDETVGIETHVEGGSFWTAKTPSLSTNPAPASDRGGLEMLERVAGSLRELRGEPTIGEMRAALNVLTLTPETREWLKEHDPQALAQADKALEGRNDG